MPKKPLETSTTNQVVDTFWNQFELTVDRAEKFRERQEDVYLQTVRQTIAFNRNVRDTLINLYQTTKQSNTSIVKGISENLKSRVEESQTVSPVIKEQIREASNRIEQITEAPIRITVNYLDSIDQGIEAVNENMIRASRERRNAWSNVTTGFIQAARNNQKNVVARYEECVRVLGKRGL
jgi:hypothetical protein